MPYYGPAGGGVSDHALLSDVTSDQHHAKSHTHNGDGSGTVPYSAVSGAPGASTAVVAFFGDGSDGAVTISGTTNLTQTMYYDTLIVQNGGVLNTKGWQVFAKTSITVNSGGIIAVDGGAASGVTAGSAAVGATYGGGGTGATGNATSNPAANGTAVVGGGALGGAGAGGGNGTSHTGGNGGSAGLNINGTKSAAAKHITWGLMGGGNAGSFTQLAGGGGGAAGGGDGSATGGGGGGGGGGMLLSSPTITNNGTVRANGGAGGNGSGGNTGSGGGGGGGFVLYYYNTFTGSAPVAAGGSPGSKVGTGTNGGTGTSGTVQGLTVNA